MNNADISQAGILGTEKISKLILRLSLPAIAGQLINLLYNLVDRVYIGHIEGVGKLALTGVGVCLPIIMMISAFAALAAMGSAPRASIFMGKGDKNTSEKILGNSFTLLVIISIVLIALIQLWAEPMLLLFGASENTIAYALDYMLIYSIGTIFVQLTLGLNAFISAQGFAKISMLTVLIGALCNIVLDPIFIFSLDMGVRGAALATIISQGISTIWILAFLTGKKTILRLRLKYMRLRKEVILPCLALGISPFIMQSTESVLYVCYNTSLLKYGGDLAVVTITILNSIFQLSIMPLMGLGQGVQPIISYNYGAKNAPRVREAFRLFFIISMIYVLAIWGVVRLFPEFFITIFNNDPELLIYAKGALRIYTCVLFVMGAQMAFQQSFISLGDAKSSLAAALVRKIIILIPMIYILPALDVFPAKDMAVFAAEPVSDILAVTFTSILFAIRFKKLMAPIDAPPDRWRYGRFYLLVRKVIASFTGPMKTLWQTPFEEGPAVFVCNHDRAWGPIAMCAHFDRREQIRPWINSEVMSFKTMVPYIRKDFWYPPNKWYTKLLDYTVPYLCSLIVPPVMRGSGGIPVYHDTGSIGTLRSGIAAMRDGYCLILFPERPSGYGEYNNGLYTGFFSLGKLLYKKTGQCLNFYPTFIDWQGKEIRVGNPLRYDPMADAKDQSTRFADAVDTFFSCAGRTDLQNTVCTSNM